ncbi:helix-turn-helix domain-containing protein [Nonomuraea sp. NPDC050786]|uniref:TetR/AcrR family transcriptional regulator n=1 Tax=Nonomuraea sp. NPDC050786 TaxID=3154840 RepID=UPI0033C74D53
MTTTRRPRADARRNYERLLAEADAAFRERGVDASLESIARRAGVAIGTLYGHFSSRRALVGALLRERNEALFELGDQLLTTLTPGTAPSRGVPSGAGPAAIPSRSAPSGIGPATAPSPDAPSGADPAGAALDALAAWVRAATAHAATYSGLASLLADGLDDEASELHDSCLRMAGIGERLIARARASGAVRADATGADVTALTSAAAWLHEHVSPPAADRLITVTLDGLAARR